MPVALNLRLRSWSWFIGFLLCASSADAGKLSKIKRDVEESSSQQESEDESYFDSGHAHVPSASQSSTWSYPTVSDLEVLFETVEFFLSPLLKPYAIVERDWFRGKPGLLDYPYQEGYDGYGAEAPTLDVHDLAVRVAVDKGAARWGERFGGEVRLTFPSRTEVTLRTQAFFEPLEGGSVDSLYLLDAGVGYIFALGQLSQFRVGLEGVAMGDTSSPDALGWAVSYGVDCFPRRPFSLSLDVGLGRIAGLLHVKGKGSVGVMLGPVEPMAAYEFRSVGTTKISTWSAGVRLWF